MRVLVLSSTYPRPSRPNFGVFVRERVRRVAARCDLAVVAPVPWFPGNRWLRGEGVGTGVPVDREDGITVYRPRFLSPPAVGKTLDGVLYAARLAPFLQRLRRRFPFELIDAHFTYPDGVAAAWLGRWFRVPVVVTVRGTHDIRHAGYALRRRQITGALTEARRVITVSESLREFAVGLGIAPGKISVVRNGIDAARFGPGDRAAARAQLGLPAGRTILVAVGALTEGKGHGRVIDALPEIVARRPDVLYVALGAELHGTGERAALEAQVARRGLADHVRLVGARPHAEIPAWMGAADLFCLATRSEGMCNAIIEALACGLPVVSTQVGGNPELVSARDGILVPFWDGTAFAHAVLDALQTGWDRAGIAARARAHGWERTAESVVEEFELALRPLAEPVRQPAISAGAGRSS